LTLQSGQKVPHVWYRVSVLDRAGAVHLGDSDSDPRAASGTFRPDFVLSGFLIISIIKELRACQISFAHPGLHEPGLLGQDARQK
jgi:hypothetical protein